MQQAVQFALSVREAEKQERFNKSFYTRFESSVSLKPKSSSQEYSESERSRHVRAARKSITQEFSAMRVQEVPTWQSPLPLVTSKPKRPFGVTSAKAKDTMQGNVPLG